MDFDVGNQKMLETGAYYQRGSENQTWRPMSTAPRDGTWVELKNTYGVAPWYCIARWTDENISHGSDGRLYPFKSKDKSWVKREGGGPFSESHLQWRPYSGKVEAYVDPTGGAQDSPAYWRGAVAAKYGLPLDTFEKQVEQNLRREEPKKKRGFWNWLWGE